MNLLKRAAQAVKDDPDEQHLQTTFAKAYLEARTDEARPVTRNDVLEEAAKVADIESALFTKAAIDTWNPAAAQKWAHRAVEGSRIAAAIRALKREGDAPRTEE